MEMDESCLHIMSSKKVTILLTALAPVRSKKSKKCNYSSSFMVNAASSPNHSFAMTFHPFTILRLLERKEKIFHELEKMAERLFAEIDQQTWFSRMLCWQIFTGTLLLVQMRSLYFQGIKKTPGSIFKKLRSFQNSLISYGSQSFPLPSFASSSLHFSRFKPSAPQKKRLFLRNKY